MTNKEILFYRRFDILACFYILLAIFFVFTFGIFYPKWDKEAKMWDGYCKEVDYLDQNHKDNRLQAAYANAMLGTNYDIDDLEPVFKKYKKHFGRDKKLLRFGTYVFAGKLVDENYEYDGGQDKETQEFRAYIYSYGKAHGFSGDGSANYPKDIVEAAMKEFVTEDHDKYEAMYMMRKLFDMEDEPMGEIHIDEVNRATLYMKLEYTGSGIDLYRFKNQGYTKEDQGVNMILQSCSNYLETGERDQVMDYLIQLYTGHGSVRFFYGSDIWLEDTREQIEEEAKKRGVSMDSQNPDYDGLRKLVREYWNNFDFSRNPLTKI